MSEADDIKKARRLIEHGLDPFFEYVSPGAEQVLREHPYFISCEQYAMTVPLSDEIGSIGAIRYFYT